MGAGVRDESFGRVDAVDLGGSRGRQDRLRERAGPAADVEPPAAWRPVEPGEEFARNTLAPTTEVSLIRVAAGPDRATARKTHKAYLTRRPVGNRKGED